MACSGAQTASFVQHMTLHGAKTPTRLGTSDLPLHWVTHTGDLFPNSRGQVVMPRWLENQARKVAHAQY